VAYIFLFSGWSENLLTIAIIASVIAALEQILITLVCHKKSPVNVKSLWHILSKN
jgi:hypothetical protein